MNNAGLLTTWLLLLSLLQGATLQAVQASEGPQPQFFAAIGAGISDKTAFRTQFEFMNEEAEAAGGQLDFFLSDGGPLEPQIFHTWVGEAGSWDFSGSSVSFLIPGNSSLILTLVPVEDGNTGWSRFQGEGSIQARAVLQVAQLSDSPVPSPSAFEHYIQNLAEIETTAGVKSFVLPIWLFEGLERISTAFAVVNLAGVPAEVSFSYRPGHTQAPLTKTVRLKPGEMVADYFDRFWPLGFPDIFPFEMRAAAEVESAAPLGATVFRTLAELPVSGIKVIAKAKQRGRVEVNLDAEFSLDINQNGVVEAENLEIEFWNVVEDSRCPSDEVCVWEGRAVIELDLFQADREPQRVRLATDSGDVRFENYLIQLVKVDPIPVSSQEAELSDYRITLVVSKD